MIWLSRAGLAIGADGQPVEAESSPASAAAQVAEKHLRTRLFPPGRRCGRSRLQINEIQSLRYGLVSGPDMKGVVSHHESVVLITPIFDGRLPDIVTGALTKFGPYDLAGITVMPVVTLADSTGEVGDALLADLRAALPGAELLEPLVLLGEKPEAIESRLDELIK